MNRDEAEQLIASIQAASPEAAQWAPSDYFAYDVAIDPSGEGFLVSRETAPGEREILNLAVAPEARRRGVARRLWEGERRQGADAWFLEVRASNQPAIDFYTRCGFSVCGRRPGYYHAPPEDGLVMKFHS